MLELLNELERMNDPLWDDELFIDGVMYWPMAYEVDSMDGMWFSAVGTDGSLLTFLKDED